MTDRGSSSLESVLGSPSIDEIYKLSPYAIKLAKRWVKEWPGKTRELEATGKLVPALKQRAEIEALHEWRERIRAVRDHGDSPSASAGDSAPPPP